MWKSPRHRDCNLQARVTPSPGVNPCARVAARCLSPHRLAGTRRAAHARGCARMAGLRAGRGEDRWLDCRLVACGGWHGAFDCRRRPCARLHCISDFPLRFRVRYRLIRKADVHDHAAGGMAAHRCAPGNVASPYGDHPASGSEFSADRVADDEPCALPHGDDRGFRQQDRARRPRAAWRPHAGLAQRRWT